MCSQQAPAGRRRPRHETCSRVVSHHDTSTARSRGTTAPRGSLRASIRHPRSARGARVRAPRGYNRASARLNGGEIMANGRKAGRAAGMNMTKSLLLVALGAVFITAVECSVASAANFSCPAPSAVNCVPAQSHIAGWKANGGQMTGNTFAPNDQCANVISLSNGTRLLCCYTKCGVFTRDVKATKCEKVSESQFVCH